MPNTDKRLSIVGTLYHQIPGHNPTSFSIRCKQTLENVEEPYQRTPPKPANKLWTLLDFGWLSSCSVCCLRNLSEDNPLVIGVPSPTTSEVKELPLSIPPGMITLLYPQSPLAIRCPDGDAQYSLFVVPE